MKLDSITKALNFVTIVLANIMFLLAVFIALTGVNQQFPPYTWHVSDMLLGISMFIVIWYAGYSVARLIYKKR